jgi:hypothetical protein
MSFDRWLFKTERHRRSIPPPATRLLSSRTSVCWVTQSVRNSYNSSTSTRRCSRADRERTHERPPTLPQGVHLLPFTHPRSVFQQLSSNHCHVHSIPSSYSYYNTSSSPCSSNHSPSAPLSRLRPTTPVLSSSCSSNSLRTRNGGRSHLTLIIKLIIGGTDAGEPRPGWMRVVAMEIMLR